MNDVTLHRRALLERLKAGDETVRADLVESFTPYVATIARNYVRTRFPDHVDDAVAEAMMALFGAAQRFDPSRCRDPVGAFTLDVAYRVRSAVRIYVSKNCAYTVGVSEATQQRIAEVARIRSALRQELGREPTVEEVTAQTDYTVASVRRYLMKATEGHVDLEPLRDWIGVATWRTPEAQALNAERKDVAHVVASKTMKLFTQNERAIIERSFALGDHEEPENSVQQTSNPTAARTVRKRQRAALDRAGRLLRIAAV